MLIDAKGKYGRHLWLGVQTNPGLVASRADWLARQCTPKRAKSFTITSLRHTDYHGNPSDVETGYANITVEYYSTEKEGKVKLLA